MSLLPTKIRFASLFLLALLVLTSCTTEPQTAADQTGRIILWHTWHGIEEEALQAVLTRFREAYPEVRVISISFTADELEREYLQKVNQGLGPDMLIGPQRWTPNLAQADLIRPLDEWDDRAANFASSAALDTVQFQNRLYGLPLSQQTSGLYYNRTMVETPAATLDELLAQAEDGSSVGIGTNFEAAFWGVQAFGGNLLDDAGRVVLNQGGFANWLEWLIEARNTPNIILSNDEDLLLGLFESGELAYYVGESTELLRLQEALGNDVVGVSPLPAGPTDAAGPFLTTEALYFSTASSPPQLARAMLLAEFLTNAEQQRKLAQQTGRIPVNPRVRIDRRITPAVAAFAEQSYSATPLLLLPQVFDVIEQGEEAYIQALEGLALPAETADKLTSTVNTIHDLDTLESITGVACLLSGEVEIWHAWTGDGKAALEELADRYEQHCPEVALRLSQFASERLVDEYEAALLSASEPDLLLISNNHIQRLAETGSIQSLEDQVDTAFLQRYAPAAPDAMRYQEQLYGIPITMDTEALYYNKRMVSEPPYDISELLSQVGVDHQFVMAYTPYEAVHWGINAFGGRLFDTNGNLTLNQDGMVEWMTWLQNTDDTLGVVLVRDDREAQRLFEQGDAAYYAGRPSGLTRFQTRLGRDKVGIVPLPTGPEGAASPVLSVDGFVVGSTTEDKEIACDFIRFAAEPESQRRLMQTANLVPANINVEDREHYPAIAGFMEQANNASVLEQRPEMNTILALGDRVYEKVLEQKSDPATTLDEFTAFLMRLHTDLGERDGQAICEGREGELVVWHSLEGLEEQVLDQIALEYAKLCPAVAVELVHVPAEDVPNQLAISSHEKGGDEVLAQPDLVLAPHDLIVPLSQEQLIRPISDLVDGSTLMPYFSQAVEPLRQADTVYGLPFSMNTKALFYNTALISEPPSSRAQLLAAGTEDAPIAFKTNFLDAFWGASSQDQDLSVDGNAISSGEQALLDVFQTGLTDWLKTLQVVQHRPGVVLGADADQLRELFLTGKAAYLVAETDDLALLRSEMSDDTNGGNILGVSTLPDGPNGPSAPLLEVDAFLFGVKGDDLQSQLALHFSEFATSGQSQSLLMSEAARIPANTLATTNVDDPQIEELVRQTSSTVPMPPRQETLVLAEHGDALYRTVLSEMQPPTRAVADFLTSVAEAPRPAVVVGGGNGALSCTEEGALTIWISHENEGDDRTLHGQLADEFAAMTAMVSNFEVVCPAITVAIDFLPRHSLQDRLSEAGQTDTMPDLVLGPHALIAPLADAGLIRAITSELPDNFLDRYHPKLASAVEYGDEMYGVPVTVHSVALYYNSELLENGAAETVDELLATASPSAPAALQTDFRNAFWGISAFGEPFVSADGHISSNQSGVLAWLEWLQSNQSNPDLLLSQDADSLTRRFIEGQASYLIDGPEALAAVREALGSQARVIGLPSGPSGEATPLVTAGVFLFTNLGDEDANRLQMIFADFATSQEMQSLLLEPGRHLPANRTVSAATSDPAVKHFVEMVTESGVILPSEVENSLTKAEDDIYGMVLDENLSANDAVDSLLNSLDVSADAR